MAEAVKPIKQKVKKELFVENKPEKEETNEKELTDAGLEKRLKSLTSFINNIDPTPSEETPETRPETVVTDEEKNAYYEMISEKAAQSGQLNFGSLKTALSDIEKRSEESSSKIEIKPTRGPLEDEAYFQAQEEEAQSAASAPPVHQLETTSSLARTTSLETSQSQQRQYSLLTSLKSSLAYPFYSMASSQTATVSGKSMEREFNLERIKQVNKLHFPRLNWNKLATAAATGEKSDQVLDKELLRFFDSDPLCKELEVYYKCKQIKTEQFTQTVGEFVRAHSLLSEFQFNSGALSQQRHEFYQLLSDYYEARKLVIKCERHINKFKWHTIADRMKSIWTFEKYTIESHGQCGDQQRCKHELTCEKAYLNQTELSKLKTVLFELRFELIKNGLISAQFCTRLAKCKLESYLREFLIKFEQGNNSGSSSDLNSQLKILIDILFYFYRRHNRTLFQVGHNNPAEKIKSSLRAKRVSINKKIYYELDDTVIEQSTSTNNGPSEKDDKAVSATPDDSTEKKDDQSRRVDQNDQEDQTAGDEDEDDDNSTKNFDLLFKSDVSEWLSSLCSLLVTTSNKHRLDAIHRNSLDSVSIIYEFSTVHFDNVFFLLQHLLRSPDALRFSRLVQLPLLIDPTTNTAAQQQHQLLFRQLGLNDFKSDQLINFYFDFYLRVFASFAYGIKYRREFLFISDRLLQDVKKNLSGVGEQSTQEEIKLDQPDGDTDQQPSSSSWEFVNLEGHVESLESVMVDITEDDLIKMYYQIPLNQLLSFLWSYLEFQEDHIDDRQRKQNRSTNAPSAPRMPEPNQQAEFRYNYVSMKILSFLDCVTRLHLRSLLIYNLLKHKNFSKLVGRTLRQTLHFLTTLMDKKSDRLASNPTFVAHYNNFIVRLFSTLIYSPRLTSIRWTIICQLLTNNGCTRQLTLSTKWLMLSLMCGIDVYHQNFYDMYIRDISQFEHLQVHTPTEQANHSPKEYILQSCDSELETILTNDDSTMNSNSQSDVELLSFIRALHFLLDLDNEANFERVLVNWTPANVEFALTVIKVVFRVSYCFKTTKDVCYKEGNSLLFAICSTHPYMIGLLLQEIDSELMQIGKRALSLCSELPFNKWLPYISLNNDLFFLQKCLLMTPTNSILFRIAMQLIDSLDFNGATSPSTRQQVVEMSRMYLNRQPQMQTPYGLVDLELVFKIKLAVILFELHSRLTIYNYFARQHTDQTVHCLFVNVDAAEIRNVSSRDELGVHYAKLAKDKRLDLTYWIWSSIYRLNLFIQLESPELITYIESLSFVYSSEPFNSRLGHQSYLSRFQEVYLTQPTQQPTTSNDESSNTTDPHSSLTLNTVLQPRCPLECYLRLILTSSGHSFSLLLEQPHLAEQLIQTVLSLNKKQTAKFAELTYMLLFDWLDHLVRKYAADYGLYTEISNKFNELRLQQNTPSSNSSNTTNANTNNKFATLVLLIFTPSNTNKLVESYYSTKIYKQMDEFLKNPSHTGGIEGFNNYFKLWMDVLMIKNWHKYKSLVKQIDFMIKFMFYFENAPSSLNNASRQQSISHHLIDKLLYHVRSDFGLVSMSSSLSSTSSSDFDTSVEIGQQPINDASADSVSIVSNPATSSGLVSNWFHPSVSWLSSSLNYVVSTTTAQIGNTVSAYVYGSGNSEFFDSIQLFSYDKRLYKEFPYIGFYLSLCEERIESELEFWSVFRSLLMNDPVLLSAIDGEAASQVTGHINSPGFIESCWRKTLQFVNRTKHLNLSIPPQRLMLFKWCERACDLPVEEPILILYWQKYFQIYLDKDYLISTANTSRPSNHSIFGLELRSSSHQSTSNKPVESVTYKMFTSTSQMNTLLKQIKKQLEAASHYYAYQIKSSSESSSSSNRVSAPIATYHFTETMSKLYYALSLWTDEVRLHDPSLYLPALPEHYEPNLLARVFNKQAQMWLEYLDTQRIQYHLSTVLSSVDQLEINKTIIKNRSSNFMRKSGPTDSTGLFFNKSDTMLVKTTAEASPVVNIPSPLVEKYGDVVDRFLSIDQNLGKKPLNRKHSNSSSQPMAAEIQLILNVTESLVKAMFKYNKEFINHSLNCMVKLDEKLCGKLLTNLWCNEVCEKYLQVPCTSLLNPMHQCTRPAMVKFVYELATKRDQYREDIKENRHNHDKLIANFFDMTVLHDSNGGANEAASDNNEMLVLESGDDPARFEVVSKFPHDDIVRSMVALNQLVKRLIRNNTLITQQLEKATSDQEVSQLTEYQDSIDKIITKLFYMLLDLYESYMSYPNDLLSLLQQQSSANSTWQMERPVESFSMPLESLSSLNSILDDPYTQTDSIHLFTFDLINMIGSNFKHLGQKHLLDILLKKLSTTISLSDINMRLNNNTPSEPSTSTRRNTNIVLTHIRNKMSLITLCSQYIEPNDLLLFNQYYKSVLMAIKSVLYNNNSQVADASGLNINPIDVLNQKFSIMLKLLTKFSFVNLEKLIDSHQVTAEKCEQICSEFIDTNLNFLTDLNFSFDLINFQTNNHLKHLIDQCIMNYVSILNIDYPTHFMLLLKKCLEFNAREYSLKYGSLNLSRLLSMFKQNETLGNSNESGSPFRTAKKNGKYDRVLSKSDFETLFEYLIQFFRFEQLKFRSQNSSFYLHWSLFVGDLSKLYSALLVNYFERFVLKNLNQTDDPVSFEKEFESTIWKLLIDLYTVWIEPSSLIEVTSQFFINVNDMFNETKSLEAVNRQMSDQMQHHTTPQMAIFVMFDSFLASFDFVCKSLLPSKNIRSPSAIVASPVKTKDTSARRNYLFNKFLHFYYEEIVCSSSLASQSSINDNTLDCYHKCLGKYFPNWYSSGNGVHVELDFRSISLLNEICLLPTSNVRVLKFLAFNLITYLDLSHLTDSYIHNVNVTPAQVNDLLKCLLNLLTEFCLRDQIRDSTQFDKLLRPVYNQAEALPHWSLLSDTSYSEVVIDRFCQNAQVDYRFVLASRGTERGLLINLLKSAAEFYTVMSADRSSISCFSSVKRRLYLRALCHVLLNDRHVSAQIFRNQADAFQTCVMNLLTDIETFSMSSASSSASSSSSWLKHEIELLIDECLGLVSTSNLELSDFFQTIFESWLSSSKDSPILINFINRLSRSYDLYHMKQAEKYSRLLEMCLEVYFENKPANANTEMIELNILINNSKNELGQLPAKSSWRLLMDNIEFKMNDPNDSSTPIFEITLLKNSSYLLLNCYMSQRVTIFKAIFTDRTSSGFLNTLYKYCDQLASTFLLTSTGTTSSQPKPGGEEKFVLIVNKLIEFYLLMGMNLNHSASSKFESKIGEQLTKLCQVLIYYGEDSLSNQNPLNDVQTTGSDLLSSIGLNILAKKSPLSLKFRFFAKCMAICLLKQILITDGKQVNEEKPAQNNILFPNIPIKPAEDDDSESERIYYKLRMQHTDVSNITSESINFQNDSSSSTSSFLSTSLPSTSYLTSRFASAAPTNNTSPVKTNSLINNLNSLLKQAAYQFHLIYQTKTYNTIPELIDLANYVNQHLQPGGGGGSNLSSTSSQHFCLPQCLNMSRYLAAKLFPDKYYLY